MELLEFVRYSAKIIDVHVPDENRSFVIFETLNDRGLNLNTADLLKNHLFGTAGKNYLEETKRRWSEMVGALGSDDRDGEIHDKFCVISGVRRPELHAQRRCFLRLEIRSRSQKRPSL